MSINFLFWLITRKEKILNKPSGFTLIELLVVIIILGILSAASLPTIIGQIGKAREGDTLAVLGNLNRSQQAYHYEKGQFAPDVSSLTEGSLTVLKSKFHNINEVNVSQNTITYDAIPTVAKEQVRHLALGVYFDPVNAQYAAAICRGKEVGAAVSVGGNPDDDCTNGGTRIR